MCNHSYFIHLIIIFFIVGLWFYSHLLVVLLQVDEFLLQRLDLHLQVGSRHRQLVEDLPQPSDVSLHTLTHAQLVLVPVQQRAASNESSKPWELWELDLLYISVGSLVWMVGVFFACGHMREF